MATTRTAKAAGRNHAQRVALRRRLQSEAPGGSPPGRVPAPPAGAAVPGGLIKIPDFEDPRVKPRWEKIIDRRRVVVETDVLAITKPRGKLDAIAKQARDALVTKLLQRTPVVPTKGGIKLKAPEDVTRWVRRVIQERGYASEMKKVTDRLNARRMSDGRRSVLSVAYVYLLAKLFERAGANLGEMIKDDLGVAEEVMVDLDSKEGALEVFTGLIVESVMDKNRITKSDTLKRIVSLQVRAGI